MRKIDLPTLVVKIPDRATSSCHVFGDKAFIDVALWAGQEELEGGEFEVAVLNAGSVVVDGLEISTFAPGPCVRQEGNTVCPVVATAPKRRKADTAPLQLSIRSVDYHFKSTPTACIYTPS